MCSPVPAQSRAAHTTLGIAAWLAALGLLGSAWGCRVKRVDPGESSPTPSPAAPGPSGSAPRSATRQAPAPPSPSAQAAPTATPARPIASTAPPPRRPPPQQEPARPAELPAVAAVELPPGAAAAAFAGPATDPAHTQSLLNAVRHALRALVKQSSPLDAAVAGTAVAEEDPVLNAGAGAALRIDGSAELEVLVMDSTGRLGGAAAVKNVKHPVRLAFAAASSPHRLLVGEGAQRVAEWLGLPASTAKSPRQLQTYESLVARFAPGQQQRADTTAWGTSPPGPGANAWRAYLDPAPPAPAPAPTAADAGMDAEPPAEEEPPVEASTPAVALLVRSGPSAFAGAVETGGAWLALPGSVGAVATPGASLYVASRGAVALAGPNEQLMSTALARRTYEKMLAFQSARAAATWALEQAAGRPISVLVMDARNTVTLSNSPTAWAKADPDESTSAPSTPGGPPR